MVPTDDHMPDVDPHKHSLQPMGIYDRARNVQIANDTPKDYRMEDGNRTTSQDLATRRLKKNRAPKPDSIIAAMCQWTVKHQVGTI